MGKQLKLKNKKLNKLNKSKKLQFQAKKIIIKNIKKVKIFLIRKYLRKFQEISLKKEKEKLENKIKNLKVF